MTIDAGKLRAQLGPTTHVIAGILVVMRLVGLALVVGCSGTTPPEPPADDGPPPGSPTVTLLSPNGGESFEAAEPVAVSWTTDSTAITYDLELVDGDVATPIATGLTAGSTTWTPTGVPAPMQFRIRIRATDAAGLTGSDDSDGEVTVTPPATGVSLAADLGPIFAASCTSQFCHSQQTQASSLVLTVARAHAQLVGVPSLHAACSSFDRVVPGEPTQSFLVFKLQGNGACFAGVRMPKGFAALPAAQIQLVRDWITEGAKNN